MHAQKINPLVLSSPHATGYRRQDSTSSTMSSFSTTSNVSDGLTYSPPSSPTSSSISLDIDYSKNARATETRGQEGEVDLYRQALLLLDLLYNNNITDSPTPLLKDLIHPSCTFEVEQPTSSTTSTITSRDSYLQFMSAKLQSRSNIKSRVKECVVDEGQRKVWVVSELICTLRAGEGGKEELQRKESIDMLTFDSTGRLVRREGWLRRSRRGSKRRDDD